MVKNKLQAGWKFYLAFSVLLGICGVTWSQGQIFKRAIAVTAQAIQPGQSTEATYLDPNFGSGQTLPETASIDLVASQTARSAIRFFFTNGLAGSSRGDTLGYVIYRNGVRHDIVPTGNLTTYTDHWLANVNRRVTIATGNDGATITVINTDPSSTGNNDNGNGTKSLSQAVSK